MKIQFEDLLDKLKSKNIHLSHQRLKVLEFLTKNYNHPTADQIYSVLRDDIPTLSKATVYNTLNSLTDAGIIRVINIDDNEAHYDINIGNHGHFRCERCKKIYDFDIDINSLETQGLEDFQINERDVYFKGICPECLNKKI